MDNEKWLEERRKGIGGSDAAAICGVSPYRTPYQVWEDKRGLSGPVPDNDSMLWGRVLEPVIRQRYSDVTGRAVKILPKENPILYHPKYPFMLANLDGFTDDRRIVEIKTAKFPTDWGEEGSDQIPLVYMFQVQHYLSITAYPVADIAVLIGGSDFRIYEVPADKELQEMLIEREAAFWKLVQDAIPPDPVNYEDIVRRFRVSQAKSITATAGVVDAVEDLLRIKNALSELKENEEKVKARIMEEMQEADTLIDVDGSVLVTWKTGKPVNRLDGKALQKEQPEIYAKYLKPGEGVRRFLIKGE